MKDKIEVTPIYWHEALHVCSVIKRLLQNELIDHIAVKSNAAITKKLSIAASKLAEAYAMISDQRFKTED